MENFHSSEEVTRTMCCRSVILLETWENVCFGLHMHRMAVTSSDSLSVPMTLSLYAIKAAHSLSCDQEQRRFADDILLSELVKTNFSYTSTFF